MSKTPPSVGATPKTATVLPCELTSSILLTRKLSARERAMTKTKVKAHKTVNAESQSLKPLSPTTVAPLSVIHYAPQAIVAIAQSLLCRRPAP
jgi:hypothetical protein